MKKRELNRIFAAFLLSSAVLAGCNTTENTAGETGETENEEAADQVEEAPADEAEEAEEVNYAEVFNEAVTELNKAKEGEEVDFAMVTDLYTENLQSLVQKRDSEFEDQNDLHITTALEAGSEGTMDPVVVKQIFDKLMQKVFYTTVKHEFSEIGENWGKTEEVNEEIEEAKDFYAILQPTVEKRDAAYGTNLVEVINGGFEEIEAAVEADDKLAFQLGKQVVDKTMMKTFYLAAGAVPHGYATKAAAEEDKNVAKVEQAEGWAFYQSVAKYLNSHAEEEATFIENQFNLETDTAEIDPEAVNKAFIRGFSKIALDEYKESLESWGEDKSVITALEGALFIDIIGEDIKTLIGEEEYTALTETAQAYLEAAKSGDKETGEALMTDLEAALQNVIQQAK